MAQVHRLDQRDVNWLMSSDAIWLLAGATTLRDRHAHVGRSGYKRRADAGLPASLLLLGPPALQPDAAGRPRMDTARRVDTQVSRKPRMDMAMNDEKNKQADPPSSTLTGEEKQRI